MAAWRWNIMPWLGVVVVGFAVMVLTALPPPTVSPAPVAVTSPAIGPRTVALPTGDRLAGVTDGAGQTLVSPQVGGSGLYVTEQFGSHHYVFPAAVAADRGARTGGRSRYDVSPSAASTTRGSTDGAVSPRYPMRTVTLNVLDADGRPAASGWADLVNTDDSARYAAETQITGGQARVSVPDGHYGGLVGQETWNGNDLVAARLVFVEFTVDGDPTAVTADARTATRVSVSTPRPADVQTQDVVWSRGSDDDSAIVSSYIGAPASTAFYV